MFMSALIALKPTLTPWVRNWVLVFRRNWVASFLKSDYPIESGTNDRPRVEDPVTSEHYPY